MLGTSADTTTQEVNIIQSTMQALGGGWCCYLLVKHKALLCNVHYYSNFAILKKVNSHAADELVKSANIIFTELGFLKDNYFRCRHKVHIKYAQTILQADEYKACNNIIILLPVQWPGGKVHKICKMHN